MRTDTQQQRDWSGNLEQLEDRLFMSADPLGGLLGGSIQHHAIAEDLPPAIEHHAAVDAPPALEHHLSSDADFWIDSDKLKAIDQELGRIEQSLANAHDQSGLTEVRNSYGFDGTGQTVAVIDSGIAYDHFALGGGLGANYRVVGGWDFTGENDADPYDDGGSGSHGTHVSGIIGASGGTHTGVAPGVDLVGLRVFDDVGNGYFSWVENALDWVHENRNSFENPITAVNLSLGVASWNADAIPSWANLEDEFAQLEADGIFVAVSAGNSFGSFNEAGLSYPAASPYVIPVASVDDSGLLSYFSQRNSRVIAAPGRGIISTVPDYAGNNNGTVDDYASFSGTSMASPYVAGASVIIREAMEFAGYTNITQDTIYDHMIDTADSFYDSATSAYYNRLNLESAIDALMPTDDYGSTVATAYDLGTISDSLSTEALMSGAITTLDDIDYFKFTAASNGTVSFTVSNMTHNIGADWDVTGGTSSWGGANNETLTVDVVAGQEYSVGFSSDDGLGYYDLNIVAESTFSYTDWGSISFTELQGVSIAGEEWYRVSTDADGYFTAQALFDAAGGQVNLELYNASLELIDSGNASGGESRVDYYGVAGDELYIKAIGTNSNVDFRLTNLVSINGTTVNVAGTAGDDSFTFEAGNTHQVSVNGVDYSFAAISINAIDFDGGSGYDEITMIGTAGDETATLRVGSATFAGNGFTTTALGIENVSVEGNGGYDVAHLYDSAADDQFHGQAYYSYLQGDGYLTQATGFARVEANAIHGGNDLAFFYDSATDDEFHGKAEYSYMRSDGFLNLARGFDRVEANATQGGFDQAFFYDTAGDDQFYGRTEYSYMRSGGIVTLARGFDRSEAYATAGGFDQANFFDSASDDEFHGKADYSYMRSDGVLYLARGFDRVEAHATAGGFDQAFLYDSATDDEFHGKADYSYMRSDGFLNLARGFDRVEASASEGGFDKAFFNDSATDDEFHGKADYSYMRSDGFLNLARGFDRVEAYASAGGYDKAFFYDSATDDQFFGRKEYSYMRSDGFLNLASGFDRVEAYATAGGYDQAYLYDTAGDDQFHGKIDYAYMRSGTFVNLVSDFDRVEAYATAGGNDQAYFYDTAGDDQFFDKDDYSYLRGNGRLNLAQGFQNVDMSFSSGGYDQAFFLAFENGVDTIVEEGGLISVSRLDHDTELSGHDLAAAYAEENYLESLDTLFEHLGSE